MGQSLEELQAEFLAKGGAVESVPTGMSALAGASLPPMIFTNRDAERRASDKKKRIRAQSATIEDDKAMVVLINNYKLVALTNVQLYRAVGTTNDRLQRVLRDYFKGDKTVDRFRAMGREDRNRRDSDLLLAAIKAELDNGQIGLQPIARTCGASTQRVSALARKNGLVIPRGDPMLKANAEQIPVPVGQLQRWTRYITDHQIDELELEILSVLKKGEVK